MKSTCAVLIFLVVLVGLTLFMIISGQQSVLAQQASTINLTGVATPTHTPGLVVYGTVKNLAGEGVEGVNIYRRYASYPGVLIATTDINGYYESEFYYIPGDEMVTVWAVHAGLVFEPDQYFWRHYYSYQRAERNFFAHLPYVYYFPMVTR